MGKVSRAGGLAGRGRALLHAVRDAPGRVRTAARVTRTSGMLWELRVPGVIELVRGLASGSQNPALVYRVHGRNTPEKIALVDRGRRTTFAELDGRVDRIAAALERRGIGRRERVVLMMRNRQELVEVSAGAARAGAGTVAISWRSTAQELVYLATHSGARGIVLEQELLPVLDEARPHLPATFLANVVVVGDEAHGRGTVPYAALLEGPPRDTKREAAADEDASLVIYTSGTTGKPKGAVRKFPKNALQAALAFLGETPLRVDDVHLVTCPLYHSTAFAFMTFSLILGSTVVLMDRFEPEAFLRDVETHRVSTTAVVPTMLQRVLDLPAEVRRRHDTRSLRVVFSGGAPLPAPVATEFMDVFGDVLFNFYGATETGLVTLAKPADLRAAPGTIGRALPGNDIRLLDDDRRTVPPGAVGELFVRNDLMMAGYHADEAATRDSMHDGYFSVGDLARRDPEGRYFLEGRKRDMIISGGVNVYPAEVEGALEQHPDLAEVAVVGVPDREWGERVVAFVVPRTGATLDPAALGLFARERLAGPKVPREVVVLDALPRNPTGKVLKRELRERAAGELRERGA